MLVVHIGQPSPVGLGTAALFDVIYSNLHHVEQAQYNRLPPHGRGGVGLVPPTNALVTNENGPDLGGTHCFEGLYNAFADVGKCLVSMYRFF